MPRLTSRSARSVAAISSSEAAAAIRSRSKRAPRDHPGGRGEAELERVDGVEEVLLVLLQVLVVGQRQRVHHAVQRARWPTTRGALARSSSAASGFFFCGMIDEPLVHASRQLDEAELLAGPEHELGAQPREVGRAGRRGAEEVEDEVAVGDGVDRVRRDARRSRARAATSARSVSKFTPASAPAPSGSVRGLRRRRSAKRSRSRSSIQT